MNRLTTDGRKIHARESITLNGMTTDGRNEGGGLYDLSYLPGLRCKP